jgi:hypothetical protein
MTFVQECPAVAEERLPLVMSLMSFWGAGGVIRAGALLRADHPIVRHVPEWFVPAESSHTEVTEASKRIWQRVTETQADRAASGRY